MGSCDFSFEMFGKACAVAFLHALYFISATDIFCNENFVKKRIILDGSESFTMESKAEFNSSCCKIAFKNTKDCPTLKLSCPKFEVPCDIDNDETKVEVKIGGGQRQKYCMDSPPDLTTESYLWIFLTEKPEEPLVNLNCNVECV